MLTHFSKWGRLIFKSLDTINYVHTFLKPSSQTHDHLLNLNRLHHHWFFYKLLFRPILQRPYPPQPVEFVGWSLPSLQCKAFPLNLLSLNMWSGFSHLLGGMSHEVLFSVLYHGQVWSICWIAIHFCARIYIRLQLILLTLVCVESFDAKFSSVQLWWVLTAKNAKYQKSAWWKQQ